MDGCRSRWVFASRIASVLLIALLAIRSADAATIVALGASNTFGKGVARSQAYPAQLQVRARGYNVRVINAGVNGDTTGGMPSRLDRTVPAGTNVVMLQPGGNDRRTGSGDERANNILAIQNRPAGRGAKVIIVENNILSGLPHQPDGVHLTPEGYRMLAETLAAQVAPAIGRWALAGCFRHGHL